MNGNPKNKFSMMAAMAMAMGRVGLHPERMGNASVSFGRLGNRYKPHQGEKEKARRLRQIERGIIHVTGGINASM